MSPDLKECGLCGVIFAIDEFTTQGFEVELCTVCQDEHNPFNEDFSDCMDFDVEPEPATHYVVDLETNPFVDSFTLTNNISPRTQAESRLWRAGQRPPTITTIKPTADEVYARLAKQMAQMKDGGWSFTPTDYSDLEKRVLDWEHKQRSSGTVTGRVSAKGHPDLAQQIPKIKPKPEKKRYYEITFKQRDLVHLQEMLAKIKRHKFPNGAWDGVHLSVRQIEAIIGGLEIADFFRYRVPLRD